MNIHTVHPHALPMVASRFTHGQYRPDEPDWQGRNLAPIPICFENFHPVFRQTGQTGGVVSFIPTFMEVLN